MIPIVHETCEGAWLAAAEQLDQAADRTIYNLVVEIAKPALHREPDRRMRTVVDRFLRDHGANPVGTVAGTIFPSSEYRDFGPRGVYEVYPNEVYPEIKMGSEWGRYAQRLVRWPPGSESPVIPLELVVEKIRTQLTNPTRFRACYELPIYDPVSDGARTRGGPCLSHVSLKIGASDVLYLTALYRSHSYVERALGNFLGLAALQAFVCDQTGLVPGPLVCLSSYARLEADGAWKMGEAVQLVKSARMAHDGSDDEAA